MSEIKIDLGAEQEQKAEMEEPVDLKDMFDEIKTIRKQMKEIKTYLLNNLKSETKKEEPKIQEPTYQEIQDLIAKQQPKVKVEPQLPPIPEMPKSMMKSEKRRFFGLFKKKPVKEAIQMPLQEIKGEGTDISIQGVETQEITKCPKCQYKIMRSKINVNENLLLQVIKCKNPYCTFVKEVKFRRN